MTFRGSLQSITITLALGLMLGALAWSTAAAQPAGRPALRDRQADAAPTPTDDRAAARDRLEQAMENARRRADQLQRALTLLDEGAPLNEIRAIALADRDGRDAGRPGADRGPVGRDEAPRLLRLLRHVNPELRQRLERLRERNPERMREALAKAAPRLRELVRLRLNDPGAFEVKMREIAANRDIIRASLRYALAMRDGDQEQAEQLRDNLRDAVGAMFDLRIEQQQLRLERMAERLEQARQDVERLRENKESMIDQRVEEVIRETMERSENLGRRGGALR